MQNPTPRATAKSNKHLQRTGISVPLSDSRQPPIVIKFFLWSSDWLLWFFALSEGIKLFIDFEHNTRTIVALLEARETNWNSDAQQLREFTDVRELQRQLKASGVNMISEADESSTGPASFMIVDPDGNTILVDQHA